MFRGIFLNESRLALALRPATYEEAHYASEA
jgi:hypothetical protein